MMIFLCHDKILSFIVEIFYVILSPAASGGAGWIQALDLGMMNRVFYHHAAAAGWG